MRSRSSLHPRLAASSANQFAVRQQARLCFRAESSLAALRHVFATAEPRAPKALFDGSATPGAARQVLLQSLQEQLRRSARLANEAPSAAFAACTDVAVLRQVLERHKSSLPNNPELCLSALRALATLHSSAGNVAASAAAKLFTRKVSEEIQAILASSLQQASDTNHRSSNQLTSSLSPDLAVPAATASPFSLPSPSALNNIAIEGLSLMHKMLTGSSASDGGGSAGTRLDGRLIAAWAERIQGTPLMRTNTPAQPNKEHLARAFLLLLRPLNPEPTASVSTAADVAPTTSSSSPAQPHQTDADMPAAAPVAEASNLETPAVPKASEGKDTGSKTSLLSLDWMWKSPWSSSTPKEPTLQPQQQQKATSGDSASGTAEPMAVELTGGSPKATAAAAKKTSPSVSSSPFMALSEKQLVAVCSAGVVRLCSAFLPPAEDPALPGTLLLSEEEMGGLLRKEASLTAEQLLSSTVHGAGSASSASPAAASGAFLLDEAASSALASALIRILRACDPPPLSRSQSGMQGDEKAKTQVAAAEASEGRAATPNTKSSDNDVDAVEGREGDEANEGEDFPSLLSLVADPCAIIVTGLQVSGESAGRALRRHFQRYGHITAVQALSTSKANQAPGIVPHLVRFADARATTAALAKTLERDKEHRIGSVKLKIAPLSVVLPKALAAAEEEAAAATAGGMGEITVSPPEAPPSSKTSTRRPRSTSKVVEVAQQRDADATLPSSPSTSTSSASPAPFPVPSLFPSPFDAVVLPVAQTTEDQKSVKTKKRTKKEEVDRFPATTSIAVVKEETKEVPLAQNKEAATAAASAPTTIKSRRQWERKPTTSRKEESDSSNLTATTPHAVKAGVISSTAPPPASAPPAAVLTLTTASAPAVAAPITASTISWTRPPNVTPRDWLSILSDSEALRERYGVYLSPYSQVNTVKDNTALELHVVLMEDKKKEKRKRSGENTKANNKTNDAKTKRPLSIPPISAMPSPQVFEKARSSQTKKTLTQEEKRLLEKHKYFVYAAMEVLKERLSQYCSGGDEKADQNEKEHDDDATTTPSAVVTIGPRDEKTGCPNVFRVFMPVEEAKTLLELDDDNGAAGVLRLERGLRAVLLREECANAVRAVEAGLAATAPSPNAADAIAHLLPRSVVVTGIAPQPNASDLRRGITAERQAAEWLCVSLGFSCRQAALLSSMRSFDASTGRFEAMVVFRTSKASSALEDMALLPRPAGVEIIRPATPEDLRWLPAASSPLSAPASDVQTAQTATTPPQHLPPQPHVDAVVIEEPPNVELALAASDNDNADNGPLGIGITNDGTAAVAEETASVAAATAVVEATTAEETAPPRPALVNSPSLQEEAKALLLEAEKASLALLSYALPSSLLLPDGLNQKQYHEQTNQKIIAFIAKNGEAGVKALLEEATGAAATTTTTMAPLFDSLPLTVKLQKLSTFLSRRTIEPHHLETVSSLTAASRRKVAVVEEDAFAPSVLTVEQVLRVPGAAEVSLLASRRKLTKKDRYADCDDDALVEGALSDLKKETHERLMSLWWQVAPSKEKQRLRQQAATLTAVGIGGKKAQVDAQSMLIGAPSLQPPRRQRASHLDSSDSEQLF
jgi:hypothetical protein